jgi:crossover junction endodeoxyribonuclease RuvC
MVSTAVVESAGELRADRVLGIDPGLTRCGYAVIEPGRAGHARAIAIGVIKTSPSEELAERLAVLQRDISSLLEEHRPAQVAVERIFFQVNVQTAMSVGQASGVIMALAANSGARVTEYTPNQVKDAVAGWGGADKAQVQRMVQARLALTTPPRPADAADAAAVALCHLSTSPIMQQLRSRGR